MQCGRSLILSERRYNRLSKNRVDIDFDTLILPEVEMSRYMENCQLPDPELRTYYENLSKRVLWVDEAIDTSTLEFAKCIIAWNEADKDIPVDERKPIRMFFTSPGGDLGTTYTLLDIIRLSKTPIIGINMGECCSGAAFIFLSCQRRVTLPHGTFLLHSGSAEGISGTAEQVKSFTAEYNRRIKGLKEYLIDDIGLDKKLVTRKMSGEWYINAKEAVEIGICDRIVEDMNELM